MQALTHPPRLFRLLSIYVFQAAKAAELDVDCVCLDCEDAVAINRKADARESIVELLQTVDFGRSDVAVRINSPDSGKSGIYNGSSSAADRLYLPSTAPALTGQLASIGPLHLPFTLRPPPGLNRARV